MKYKLIYALLLFVFGADQAFSYIDPGTGSMLIGIIIGVVSTLFFGAKELISRFGNIKHRIQHGKKSRSEKHRSIVFFSEGARYWHVFQPIVEELHRRHIPCSYFSAEEDDPGLHTGLTGVETRYIGSGNKAFFKMGLITSDIVVATTPGLDVFHFKRSKGVKKYVHITHSAGGCSGYSVYGIDYYDIILTGGEGDGAMIRDLEKVRGLPPKEIHVIGCTYLDVMRSRIHGHELFFHNNNKTVLIAPSWGEGSLLNKYSDLIFNSLTESDFNIIVRPHPQSRHSEQQLLHNLSRKWPDSAQFRWDYSPEPFTSMQSTDIMLSDFSGVILDFIFLFQKPVLTLKSNYFTTGRDAMDLTETPWIVKALDSIDANISGKDLENLSSIISERLNKKTNTHNIKALANDMDKYPGESGVRGADRLEQILRTLNQEMKSESEEG